LTHTGIVDEIAPDLGVTRWVDASGQALAEYGLARMPGAYKLIFCFQHACPGCHLTGFPTLARLVEAFRGSKLISFAAVQTVFEDFEHNTFEQMLADQRKYALPIVFGHDDGQGREGAGSVLMQRYRNGGTPWFILIDPQGVVVFGGFRLDAERLIANLKKAEAQMASATTDPGVFNWRKVLEVVRDGNPKPPRRLELSEDEWRRRLSPERYRILRGKGTERAHSSSMCSLFEPGRYACAGCGTELFDATTKFDSKSGWPSFTQAISPDVVGHHDDSSHGMRRIEVTCNVCDSHLGHVFPDGPAPSGLRYCINALSLEKLA